VAALACGFFDYFRIGPDRKQIPMKAVIDDKSLSIFARNVEQRDIFGLQAAAQQVNH